MSEDSTEKKSVMPGQLIPDFIDTVSNKHAIDILGGVDEALFDAVLEDGLLKEVPLIGTVIQLGRAAGTMRDYFFLKKLYHFLYELKSIPNEKRERFRKQVSEDSKFGYKIGEKLLLLLERADDMQKPCLMAKAFAAFIDERVNQDQLSRMAEGIDRALMSDLLEIQKMRRSNTPVRDQWGCNLMSAGLMKLEAWALPGGTQITYGLNEIGKLIREICFDIAADIE